METCRRKRCEAAREPQVQLKAFYKTVIQKMGNEAAFPSLSLSVGTTYVVLVTHTRFASYKLIVTETAVLISPRGPKSSVMTAVCLSTEEILPNGITSYCVPNLKFFLRKEGNETMWEGVTFRMNENKSFRTSRARDAIIVRQGITHDIRRRDGK